MVALIYKVSQCEHGNSLEIYMVWSLKLNVRQHFENTCINKAVNSNLNLLKYNSSS